MAQYRIHRMKDQLREHFRWAAHVSSQAIVKPKDYEPSGQVEAAHEYAAWSELRSGDTPLLLGDLLETESGDLRICKYVGFETAVWFVPEPLPEKHTESDNRANKGASEWKPA